MMVWKVVCLGELEIGLKSIEFGIYEKGSSNRWLLFYQAFCHGKIFCFNYVVVHVKATKKIYFKNTKNCKRYLLQNGSTKFPIELSRGTKPQLKLPISWKVVLFIN